jgi:hypothetical protein
MEEKEGENLGGDEDGDLRKIGRRWGEKGRRRQGKRNRGGREKELPKDLCVKSENCRGLSVKHRFSINLKPE